jgi:hypothetical protein
MKSNLPKFMMPKPINVRKFLTPLRADPRTRYTVYRHGKPTPFVIAVSSTMTRYNFVKTQTAPFDTYIEIGSRAFGVNHQKLMIDGSDMPDSWFIDISGGVTYWEEEEREAA